MKATYELDHNTFVVYLDFLGHKVDPDCWDILLFELIFLRLKISYVESVKQRRFSDWDITYKQSFEKVITEFKQDILLKFD